MEVKKIDFNITTVVTCVAVLFSLWFLVEKRIDAAVSTKVDRLVYSKDIEYLDGRLVYKTNNLKEDIGELKSSILEVKQLIKDSK